MNEITREISPIMSIPLPERNLHPNFTPLVPTPSYKRNTSSNVQTSQNSQEDTNVGKKIKLFSVHSQFSHPSQTSQQSNYQPQFKEPDSQQSLNSQIKIEDPVDDNVTQGYTGNNEGLMFLPKISEKKNGKILIGLFDFFQF